MGFVRYLQRIIASLLRPFILQKEALEPILLHFHPSRIVVESRSLELDCASINSSLLSDSQFVLRHARVNHAELSLSFFRSPGLRLTIHGVHFVFNVRPPDDSFWSDRQKKLAEASRNIEMTALDPLGASVHLAAQRHLREAVTENIVKSFLAKLLLQALHVELNDVSFEHRLNTNNICNAVYFLTLGSLVLQQGYGIFGISVRWLVNVLKVSDDFYCKVCSVQKFGLVLLTSDEQSEQVKSPLSCVSLDALQSSKSSGKNNILTWTKITLILGFRNIELSGIDAAFSETILQFNVIEAEAIIKLLTTGSYKGAPGDSSRAGQSQNSQGLCESARLHWKKACESIIGNLPKKLTRITEVRMLCQRYTEIYACWLLKSGEGTFVDLGMVKCAEELKWRKSDLCSLEKDLLCLEEELPMEAIVLARFRSRKKIFTDPNRIVFTARPPAFSVRSKVSVLEALKTAYKMVKRVLMNFFNILVVFLKHFFFILGIKWVFLKWGNVLSSKCCIALAKSHAWLDSCHSAISPIMPEALEKCNYLKSKKLEGWMNFCCNFHTGSVTFVGSLECFRSFQERNGLKYWIQLLQGRYLPGLHFAFDDVSLGYSTSTTGLGCQLVCGYVQGQLVTVPARHFNAATDIEWQSDLPFIENDQLKVFKSSSAPSIRLPSIFEHQLVANNLDMSEEAKFSEFLKKDLITSGTSGKSNSERKRPFLVCSYESVQTTDTSDGKSDMIMCSLAVGCLSWKFNLETYCLFGFLSIQLLDTMKINKQLQSNETFLSELASSCMRDPVRGLWEVSYADQLRTPILSICLEREIWLVLALASPTFEFSVNNVEAGDGFTSEPTFLVNLGLLEVTIWPARVKQDQLGAEKYNEGSKQLRSMAKGERIWLKEPPGPCIERPKTIRSSFQQGVGNNGIISLSEATMSMWGLQSPESRALIKPLSMIWKISSCRDDFRLPGVHNTACVAMTGSFSGIHMDILFEEMEIYFKACRKISEVTRELLALERTYVEAFKCKERQDVLGKDASFNEPESKVSHECVYFCVSVELEVDLILCVLLDRGIKADRQSMEGIEEQKNSQSMQSLTSDNLGAVNSRHFGPLDMHRRIDEFLVRKFHLDFSWGDGCPLLLSCGFDEWGFIVRTIPGGSGTWKDKNIVLNPISHNEYDGEKCQVLLQQFSFSIDRPWCLSEFESLKPSLLDRSEDFYHKSRACWMNIKLRMGKLYINDCLSQSFMSKILSKVADASCLTVEMVVSHDYYNISVISEGGILFIHTQALLLLSKELESYKKATSFFSPSRGKPMNVNLVLPHELGRSFSLPSGRSQEREFRTKNLYSASFASHSRDLQKDPGASSGSCTWSPESVSVRVSSLCFIVAQNQSALMGEGRGGLLLELGGSLQLQTSGRKKTFFLETEKFRLSSHLKVEDSGEMVDIPSRIPRFGSNLGVHLGESSENNADKFCSPVKDKGRTDGEGVLVHSDEFEKNSRKGLMRDKEYDYIIENLGLSVNLDKDLGYLDKSNGWHGSIVLLGLDIGVTMLELQLLMSLYSSMSSLPFISSVKSESSATRDFFKPSSDESSVNGFHIPDGSVVAVKDVHEHLYMAVQRTNGSSYRLVGVLHYSLVGDQSLFKVKYHRTSRDTSQVWFSLLSVDAKDSNGEAFRLHYCPGSGLADISSTNDGSWELWQAHPYQCSPKDESHIVGFNNDSARNLVYLVNQKSKLGLTVTTGGPMMVRQPGSLFKFKILQYGSQHNPFAQGVHPLSIGLQKPANYPPCSYITIPQVELNVGRVVFTLLFESGGKYLLPLLRGRVEDTRATMHIQSHKIRVMGGYKFVFEYLEVDSNEWLAIVQPINIDLFYRVRISPEHNSVKGTLVTSFFARFKRVDILLSEKSLDVILFVIGMMKLAGPYSIKYSPVLATSCKVENLTGLDLCCGFDGQESTEALRIPAWMMETFFIRNMISRRDPWPAKSLKFLFLNLEKEGVGLSSPIPASLVEPSIIAVKTQLTREDGRQKMTGPMVVVDVSKHEQGGIHVAVSPMTRIRNCTGLTLELRCRHPKGDPKGASVFLKDGDSIDDSMGAFDAVSLEGEGKKALTSFALGDSLLSVRPAKRVPMSALRVVDADHEGFEFVWSEDIKGAKQIRSSGLLKKLKYKFRKSLRGQNTLFSFSMIFCGISDRDICREVETQKGVHILIQTSSRVVPLMSSDSLNESDTNKSVIAFKKQEEIVLLPTLCIQNFLDTKISVLATCSTGKSSLNGNTAIERGCRISFYADPAEFVFTVHLDEHNLTSNNVSIGEWDKKIERCTVPADYMNGLHKELNFGNSWCARLKMLHNDDGVLQILVFSQFAAKNSSNIPLLVCVPKNSGYSWSFWNRPNKMHFPQDEAPVTLNPGTTMSLFRRSSYILFKLAEGSSEIAILDLESFSGSTELSLKTPHADGSIEVIQLGVRIETTSSGSKDPTRLINISSRYIISNESDEIIYVCQDGLQEDENSAKALEAGQNVSLTAQFYPGQRGSSVEHTQFVGSATSDSSFFSIRFRFFQNCWDWTGPVCASAIGSFCLRVHRRMDYIDSAPFDIQTKDAEMFKFVAVEVEEKSPSLIIHFHKQTADAVPYRIENALSKASIFFHQKGVDDIVTTLEAGKRTGYAWDNLSQPHKLIISVSGTQLQIEVKLDKLVSWKPVRASKKNAFRLLFAFDNQLATSGAVDGSSANVQTIDPMKVGYEIVADGFQRVLRISEDRIVSKLAKWQSHLSLPSTRFDLRIPVFSIALVECLQYNDARTISSPKDDNQLPFIVSIRMGNLFFEILNTKEHCLFQLKVETLSVDERWEGAPFSAMLRVHTEDRFKRGETVLQMATVISNLSSDPVHVNYTSILLQTIDLNLDEETLMKLVPFYRLSLRDSKSSIQIYFERLEIHPIKIIASFLPGQPMPDYNSTQETFRTLLHSFIEVPSIRGFTVELNGVLLTHALLTFRQLAIKCAQHYSWYAMRAVYIAKGSKLLPPAFTSLFDDSAASSLDVFFDPSRGTVDIQGLTLGMFNFLSNGLKKRGLSGTNRYIGDLEHTMKTAGSNILFAVLTEVSDNVLKGAETGGFDGMVNGFRRGILNVSMEPSLLRTAVMKGGSSRRIKLDHSAGTDEAYIEGYLQAMLDTLFQQSYLKVKVVDDQVLLKNMPPSSVLADEIMSSVRTFLISEGLLAGETSATAIRSRRRLHGENDKRIVPAVIALCEQLFVIFAVRALRNETRSWLSWGLDSSKIANSKLGNLIKKETGGKVEIGKEGEQKETRSYKGIMFSFIFSSAMAYMDGRLCRHIPNRLARRIVSGFLLSFVE